MLRDFLYSYVNPEYAYDYWHFPHMCSPRIAQGDYFIDFAPKSRYEGPFDEEGIPRLALASQHWSRSDAVVYAPIVILQYALGWYSRYKSEGDPEALRRFVHVAAWMRGYGRRANVASRPMLLFPTDYGRGETLSAMAQGLAVSVWCRAFKETGDSGYVGDALLAFAPFLVDVEDGGVRDWFGRFPVLQEWANYRHHPVNGHLFAFAGIVDLLGLALESVASAEVRRAYQEYLEGSLALCEASTMGFWSRYTLMPSIVPNIASLFYHSLHVEMVKGMRQLTGEPRFDHYAKVWAEQRGHLAYRLAAMVLKLLNRVELEVRDRTGMKVEHRVGSRPVGAAKREPVVEGS